MRGARMLVPRLACQIVRRLRGLASSSRPATHAFRLFVSSGRLLLDSEEHRMSMPPGPLRAVPASQADEDAVRDLHRQLLKAWNRRAADDFAALFSEDASAVGFDGSQMDGRQQIATDIGAVLADHIAAAYVGKIANV